MRAVSRLANLLLAAALVALPAASLAQETPPPAADPPPTRSVGPRDLQNFSLEGTVTRPAEQAAPAQPPPQRAARPPTSQSQAQPRVSAARPEAAAEAPPPSASAQAAPPPVSAPSITGGTTPTAGPPSLLPGIGEASGGTANALPATPLPNAADDAGFALLPWLAAAAMLAGAGLFLWWRNRSRFEPAVPAGPQIDLFARPGAPPAPAPSPLPEPAQPISGGVVSTGLRPRLDLDCHPLRCILDDQKLTLEFELELYNSGNAAASEVLVEARIFNAGPDQDQHLGSFFQRPAAEGDRSLVISPLNRLAIKSEIVVPREQLQEYELAGKRVFVPLIGFNALYRWGRGNGQTSVSYLLGRETGGEKLGPFSFDAGSRIFRSVAARMLPLGLHR